MLIKKLNLRKKNNLQKYKLGDYNWHLNLNKLNLECKISNNNVNQRIDFTTKLKKDNLLNKKKRLNSHLYLTKKVIK